jgi:Cellulase (glycosyl hydrolase family 5)
MARSTLKIDGTRFRDSFNREVTFRGINVSGDGKLPRNPDVPSHVPENFFDADDVSFVGRPFNKEEAHEHFARLKKWGYNAIRYIFTWEAVEHAGPGKYDEEFIAHTIEMLRMAKSYGFWVFMDPHQDVWSRFSGGSGAPLWTLYACGLNPEAFSATQAAFVHNVYPDPAKFPKMLWSTNYNRLACQTLFTLFFSGKDFAPKAIIDGKNIQDYLQGHYIATCKHLAQRIHEAGDLEDECVIGWESLNEPNRGYVGWQDLSVLPSDQQLKKGTAPTGWQAILTGSGRALEIDTYEFGSFGPYKNGRELVDPEGASAWLPVDYDDTKYGWKRDPGWRLGECLWAQHGVWDPKQDKLLKKDYFCFSPKSGAKIDYEKFTNTFFLEHFRTWRDSIRSVHKDAMILCQAPVLEIPPNIKGTKDDDPRLVFASHYYDGLTLLTKHWNRYYNVDVFGVMRGRYISPAFALKIGETAIRNCLRDQLEAIRQEGLEYTGIHPCLFTEIGIPYDMDDKFAYKTGDYSSQTAAMDANHFALEDSGAAGYTLWTYVGTVLDFPIFSFSVSD